MSNTPVLREDYKKNENVRRSTRKRGLPRILLNYELFRGNEVNDDGDFVHFSLMDEFEPVNMEDALSDPKWIYAMKEELESIEKQYLGAS